MDPEDINHPKPPEGGWRKWFLEHPHQRMVLPVMRRGFTMVFDEGDKLPQPTIDTFEIWYNSKIGAIYCRYGDYSEGYAIFQDDNDGTWNYGVRILFTGAMMHREQEQPQEQPVPSGTGWEDFDWSK